MLQKTSLQTKTDVAELRQVLSWFNHFVEPFLPRLILIQCQTLLAEGFTNAVRHAHRQYSPETPIHLEISLTENQLEIRIWDYGLPFDLEHSAKQEANPADALSSGGRGLKLLTQLSDKVEYQRVSANQNCLLIVKNYQTDR